MFIVAEQDTNWAKQSGRGVLHRRPVTRGNRLVVVVQGVVHGHLQRIRPFLHGIADLNAPRRTADHLLVSAVHRDSAAHANVAKVERTLHPRLFPRERERLLVHRAAGITFKAVRKQRPIAERDLALPAREAHRLREHGPADESRLVRDAERERGNARSRPARRNAIDTVTRDA